MGVVGVGVGGGELMHSYVNCSGVELYKKMVDK